MGDCSSVADRPLPEADDGSIPIRSLHIAECGVQDIKSFIERWHYSHTIFGCTTSACFSVTYDGLIVGAAIFGLPAGMGVAAKYSGGAKLLELRKFCLADDVPRNGESRVLGVMFRKLKAAGVGVILSYADPAHGHAGTIYRATGFEYRGTTAARKHVLWNGKVYPDRNIHQIHFPYHLELRAALASGAATLVRVPGKHIFVKTLT